MTDKMTRQCEDRFDRIVERQDAIVDTLTTMNITLGEQHLTLKEHIARTELLETRLTETEAVVKPIKAHILLFNTAAKLIGSIATILVILHQLGIIKIFRG